MTHPRRASVLLACSSGGHLAQLLALRAAWEGTSRLWVTEDTSDARSLLTDEAVLFAHGPMHRNLTNGIGNIAAAWARNTVLALRVARTVRPRVVLTTGAATAIPFAWAARAFGAHVVYVESVTRVDAPSLSYRLIAPIAHDVFVQWPELAARLHRARYAGSVLPVP